MHRAQALILAIVVAILGSPASSAQEGATPPHRIPHPPGLSLGETPAETRCFRRAFTAKLDSRLFVDVTADNAFTLYLDGRPIATGGEWRPLQHVETRVAAGKHVLAASASNEAPGPAGFVLGGGLSPPGEGVPVHIDSSWKNSERIPPGEAWTELDFDDSRWVRANDLGPLGSGPWTGVVSAEKAAERFRGPDGPAAPSSAGGR